MRTGDDVILHSKLTSFGLVPGGPKSVVDALLYVVGANATIVVPCYCFQLTKDDVYDSRKTPSDNMGVNSEYVRQLTNSVRSSCPIHNHSAIGEKATDIADRIYQSYEVLFFRKNPPRFRREIFASNLQLPDQLHL